MKCIKLLKYVYYENLMSLYVCLSSIKDLVGVGKKWKMINIQVTLRLRKPTKTFRKSVNLFAKIDV